MFTVTINENQVYNCIDNISELTLKQVTYTLPLFTKKLDLELKKELLALISNIPIEIIVCMDESSVDSIINRVQYKKDDLSLGYKIEGKIFRVKNFEDLTVQEYGQLSYYLIDTNLYKNIPQIVNVLLKRVSKYKGNILYNIGIFLLGRSKVKPIRFKSYSLVNEIEDNIDLFNRSIDGALAFSIINSYLEWCNKLKKEYSLVYGKDIEEEEEEQVVSKSDPLERWGVYHIVSNISSSLMEREEWRKRSVRELLEYLTYLKIVELSKEKT